MSSSTSKTGTSHAILAAEQLRKGQETLDTLAEKYHISAKRHKVHPNLVLLKYDQIHSDFTQRLVQECRGVILDEDNQWKVVCHGFNKFFNYGDPLAAKIIDWSRARVYEKYDGSLCQMYWYEGMWRVATSGTPDASGQVGDHGFTFEQLFWEVFVELGYELPSDQHSSYTFLFELLTPYNRVVVRHLKNDLPFIGIRDVMSGTQYHPDQWSLGKYKKAGYTTILGPNAIQEAFKKLDPLEHEGYVVCDPYFNRVKFKHPGYVALHHMISSLTAKSMLDVIRRGEIAEVIASFPEHQKDFDELKRRFDLFVLKVESIYAQHAWIESQKDFAFAVKDYPFNSIMFALKKGKVSTVKAFCAELSIEKLIEWLEPR